MKFGNEDIAKRFGLERARLFVGSFYRDSVIGRYEIEKPEWSKGGRFGH
jgi:hypothetical protein